MRGKTTDLHHVPVHAQNWHHIVLVSGFGILLVMLQISKFVHRNAIVKVKHFKTNISVINYVLQLNDRFWVWKCLLLHTLHAENALPCWRFIWNIFLCNFSAFLTKLIEFYYFLKALGWLLIVFQAEKMLVNVWFMIGVCAFNRK